MALPNVQYRDEPGGLEAIWHTLAQRSTASPKLWMDANLAAFAIAGGLTLVTFDGGFNQFASAGLSIQLLHIP
jgi:predicted nucleic acid-binding protein